MKFDVIVTNPPFQDTLKRKKTPHKLWIDFTLIAFDNYLKDNGLYVQVSPASFSSPSNKVLKLMTENTTEFIRFDTDHHFPTVGSSFSDYAVRKARNQKSKTLISTKSDEFAFELNRETFYLPNDISQKALKIHRKLMFNELRKFSVNWDYVVCHNINRHKDLPTLSEIETKTHKYPVFHTNRSIWWSSIEQEWAKSKKVMWTRSGYTRPFFDDGTLGGTDMCYYIKVRSAREGKNLAIILNSPIYQYIFKTAKWSGFGNELVFRNLPYLDLSAEMKDLDIANHFKLTKAEVSYINESVGRNR